MTAQEAFDTAVKGLASQHFERSFSPDEYVNMYRDYVGRRCSIGWLIPDEEYDIDYEGESVAGLMALGLLDGIAEELAPHDRRAFFEHLQGVHDENPYPNGMVNDLWMLAHKFDLSPVVLRDMTDE